MAYRLNYTLTLGEAVKRLVDEFHCRERSKTVIGPRGPERVRWLERTDGTGTACIGALPGLVDADDMTAHAVRTLCAQLGLGPDALGVIGDTSDPADPGCEPDEPDAPDQLPS